MSRIADDNNKYIGITENDLIIFSSRVIPGNEKKISELQNKLIKKNVQFFMIKILKRMFPVILLKKNLKKCMIGYHHLIIPVHGEFRHLNEQANFAKNVG